MKHLKGSTKVPDSSVNVQIYDENGILRISHYHLSHHLSQR
jgi:hypothetical protein